MICLPAQVIHALVMESTSCANLATTSLRRSGEKRVAPSYTTNCIQLTLFILPCLVKCVNNAVFSLIGSYDAFELNQLFKYSALCASLQALFLKRMED